MSSNSKEKVKNILIAFGLEVYGTRSIPKIADHLGVTKQALYNWINDGEVKIETIKSKVPNVNPLFLDTGEGDVLKDEKQNPRTNSEDYSGVNTELGQIVRDHIVRYRLLTKQDNSDNPLDPLLLAFRDQVKSHRAGVEAQLESFRSMERILDSLIRKDDS